MNERIRALWKQAGGHYNSGNQHTWPEYTIDDPEKFADLIVKECVEQASNGNGHGNNQWDRALTFSAKNIKEHFGVDSA